jgi:hypothetical protein
MNDEWHLSSDMHGTENSLIEIATKPHKQGRTRM